MNLVYAGKTKDVCRIDDGQFMLKFKDDATGEGGVFDPGANSVGLNIDGIGKAGLQLSVMFFEALRNNGIDTHYISADIDNATMNVVPAMHFGNGVEVICRYRAAGSFIRRYGAYITEGEPLPDAFVEMTIKDDVRQDPPISRDALVMLGVMSGDEYDILVAMAKKIAGIVRDILAKKELDLYDIKFEFGKISTPDNRIVLIDEISGGNMRVYKGGACIEPLALAKIMGVE